MSDEIKVQEKRKNSKIIVAMVAAVIAVLTILAIVLVSSSGATAKKVKEQLSLGEKYLSELNYEQAIAAYELAIEIDPKCEEAYLGLAEVYEEMGEYDKAIAVLEEAIAIVEDEDSLGKVKDKLREIEEKKQEALKPVATATPVPTVTLEPTVAPESTDEVEKSDGVFKYVVKEDGTIKISGVEEKTSEMIVIAKKIEEKIVTEIGSQAFHGCNRLMSIDIPDTIVEIGNQAFVNCNLTGVNIPQSVKKIGEGVFSWNRNLKEITVDNKNTSYVSIDGVLYTSDRKELVQVPAGFEEDRYVVREGTVKINRYSLAGCAFNDIELSDSIREIESFSFSNCDNLEEIFIPASVERIGAGAFVFCHSLRSINVENESINFSSVDGVLYNEDQTVLLQIPQYNHIREVYNTPQSVVKIEAYACGSSMCSEYYIPESVKEINKLAFFMNSKVLIRTMKDSYADAYAGENKIPVKYQ